MTQKLTRSEASFHNNRRLFKLLDPKTGLFCRGGYHKDSYAWNEKGKTWTGTGPLVLHLRQNQDSPYGPTDKPLDGLVVVEVAQTEIGRQSASEFMAEAESRRRPEKSTWTPSSPATCPTCGKH